MRLNKYFAVILAWSLLQPAVGAYPGQDVGKTQKWLEDHAAFPAENYFMLAGALSSFGSFRSLPKNRELALTITYDPKLAGMPQRVLYERLSVFHQRLGTETPCHEAVRQGAANAGLIAAGGESLNQVWPACLMHTAIDFRQRDAESTVQALATVYGARDPLIADFQAATLMMTGNQYLTPAWDRQLYDTVMRPIQPGPIEEQIYVGMAFDYLVTSNTLTIVSKHEPGYWNDWAMLKDELADQQEMYQSMKPQQQAVLQSP